MNNRQPSSIFNEVYGPVMTGPSSSHTAGPARIGMMMHQMLDADPSSINVLFDTEGSFAAQYEAQGSNFGIVGGILGIDIADETIKRSLIMAKERNIKVDFEIKDLPGKLHPNFTKITVKTKNNSITSIEAESTGGGAFQIIKYNQYKVLLLGDMYEVLIESKTKRNFEDDLEKILNNLKFKYRFSSLDSLDDKQLIQISLDSPPTESLIKEIENFNGVLNVLTINPVVPVVKQIGIQVPFLYSEDAENLAKKEGFDCWDLAVRYESALSGKSFDEVHEMALYITEVMKDSAEKAVAGNYHQRGFLPPSSVEMIKHINTGIDLGVLNLASVWAAGVMEYDICMGRVVAAPTGGSSGVLPGAVVGVGIQMGKSMDEIARAILVGGLIGVFIDHKATFAAEIAACQAENGAASAMAAASMVHMLGGDVEQCFKAASLALQNMLGLICDPVAGVGNVPCVGRNSAAAANALVSANMVLWGFNPAIPLDEVIETMLEVGNMLPPELKCTGRGGLCLTKTAKEIEATLDLTPVLE